MADPNIMSVTTDTIQQDFRYQLEQFYAKVKLAPPYHSLELAIQWLSTYLSNKSLKEQQQLFTDPSLKWPLYRQAFHESGLNKKHRGVLSGIARSKNFANLDPTERFFLETFLW